MVSSGKWDCFDFENADDGGVLPVGERQQSFFSLR